MNRVSILLLFSLLPLEGAFAQGSLEADLLGKWPRFPAAYPVPTLLGQPPHHDLGAGRPASLRLWGRELTFLYYCGNRAKGREATRLRFGETVHDAIWMDDRSARRQHEFRGEILPILQREVAEGECLDRREALTRRAWKEAFERDGATRVSRRFAAQRIEQELLVLLVPFLERRYRDPDPEPIERPGGRLEREILTVLRHTRAPYEFLRWLHTEEGKERYPISVLERLLPVLLAPGEEVADEVSLEALLAPEEERWNELALRAAVRVLGEDDPLVLAAEAHPPRLPQSFPLVTGEQAYALPQGSEARLSAKVVEGLPQTVPSGQLIPLSEHVRVPPDANAFHLRKGGVLGGYFLHPIKSYRRAKLRLELTEATKTDLSRSLRVSVNLSTIPIPENTHGPVIELDLTQAAPEAFNRNLLMSLDPTGDLEVLAIASFEVSYVLE